MQPVMDPTIDIDMVTGPGNILAALSVPGKPRQARVEKIIHFFWPIFRHLVTEADVFEDASVPGGRLKVTSDGTLAAVPVRSSANWTPLTDVIGEYFWVSASIGVAVAGNANADITAFAVPAEARLYKVYQVLSALVNGAGVANRVPNIQVLTGMRQELGLPIPINAINDWQVTGGANITANQDASVFVPRAPGVVCVNSNGVMTFQAVSPLPMVVTANVRIRSLVTAGLAADAHNIIALLRRVA